MKTMVKQMQPGQPVTGYFVCARKIVKVDRNGNRYLDLRLSDSSGVIGAKMWDVGQSVADCFSAHDVVAVKGVVTGAFHGGAELKVERIRPISEDDEVDIASLLPVSPRDPAEMEAELSSIRADIKNPDLAALLDEIFRDELVYRQFCEAPAAKGFHHNYIHGLLEHTIAVCRVAGAIADQYPRDVNRDLLVTAALLHDIGKMAEFSYTTAIDYSDQGRLLGHIVIGEKMVSDAICRMESFPKELELQLLHLILAHHGEKEYGSPIRPKTLEGFILNHADDIDAKANVFMRLHCEAVETGDSWSPFNRILDRFLYLRKTEE